MGVRKKKSHAALDPLWQSKWITRSEAYAYISQHLSYPYHSGEIHSIDEARKVYAIIVQLRKELKELTENKEEEEAKFDLFDYGTSRAFNLYKAQKLRLC